MPKEQSKKKKHEKAKTVLDKVVDVILSLNQPGGSSRPAIAKSLKSIHNYENPTAFKAALKSGLSSGTLAQNGQKFWVATHPPPLPPGEDTVDIKDLEVGEGQCAESGSACTMSYRGELVDGTVFDSSKKFTFTLGAGEVIKGWDQGVLGMQVGGCRKLTVPPKLGYGKRGSPPEIPPDATLIFEVRLLGVR
mmetsp:Transcript_11977/g.33706  ORF Transcript_11977/g.33706 Transcript_11977/m.33706 type:complete len:192 (+) Transcript_11977:191-766(+)|eukprot:CAMPEP_0117654702 /NCGR_PEP_ID=MMETSP0804-20121206/3888_1 /TAXON_ID=1074897 /ORGANISM="Tetraselmis astigmatica, Strain CCMP880" /LENGTH=191 /DNA_ID=CAMNT_0005461007 /DNA_START=121 /DNA_END=696 /DNA_ORIENTATION=-